MLLSEQSDLLKAVLATAGITPANATEFDIRFGWLIVDGVPHRVYAEPVDAAAPAAAAVPADAPPPAPDQGDPPPPPAPDDPPPGPSDETPPPA